MTYAKALSDTGMLSSWNPRNPPTRQEWEQARYSVDMNVAGRNLRFANYECKTLEQAEQEIAEAFRVAREIRDAAKTPTP